LHPWIALHHPSSATTLSHITHKQQTFQVTTINKRWKDKPRRLHAKCWRRFNT
jgi:hypothetical protein